MCKIHNSFQFASTRAIRETTNWIFPYYKSLLIHFSLILYYCELATTNERFDITYRTRNFLSPVRRIVFIDIFAPNFDDNEINFTPFEEKIAEFLFLSLYLNFFLPCRVNYYAVNKYDHAWNLIDFEINLSLVQYSLRDANTERLIGK